MDNTKTGEQSAPGIEQYLMSIAKTPQLILKQVALNQRVRNKHNGAYYYPDPGTSEFQEMTNALAEADADYRYAFAQAMIKKLNEKDSEK